MRTAFHLALATCGALAFCGCSSTLKGASQDTTRNTAAVRAAGQQAATDVAAASKNAQKNVDAAGHNTADVMTLTPRVKAAIIGDVVLNNRNNHINVNVHNGVVHLEGHVLTQDMKARAGVDADTVVRDAHSPDTVSNELIVSPS